MTNEERLKFLKEKPLYTCCVTPGHVFHEVGCSDKQWTVEQLQEALDRAKRSLELQLHLKN